MWCEALMKYIIRKVATCPTAKIKDNNFQLDNDLRKKEIIGAINIVKQHITSDRSAGVNVSDGNADYDAQSIENDLYALLPLSAQVKANIDKNNITDLSKLDDAGFDIADILRTKEQRRVCIDRAFDHMKVANGQKDDVIKKLKEVSDKILTSNNTSSDLIKKFNDDQVFNIINDTVFNIINDTANARNMDLTGLAATGGNCTINYYNNQPVGPNATDVSNKADNIRKKAVANKALQDDEFRKRLDEEIKAQLKQDQ